MATRCCVKSAFIFKPSTQSQRLFRFSGGFFSSFYPLRFSHNRYIRNVKKKKKRGQKHGSSYVEIVTARCTQTEASRILYVVAVHTRLHLYNIMCVHE